MRRLRRSLLVICAAMLAASFSAARAADVEKYLPDGTVLVMTVNVKQILDSPLVKSHFLAKLQAALKEKGPMTETLNALGLDPLKDITRFTAASTGTNTDSKGLMILSGNFDPAKFEAVASKNAEQHAEALKVIHDNGRKIFEVQLPQSPKPLLVSILDKSTIVASVDKESLQEAFARTGDKQAKLTKDVEDLLRGVDTNQSLWMAMVGEALSKNQMMTSDEKIKKNLENIETISAGLTLSNDIKLLVNVFAKNDDGAKDLANWVTELVNSLKGMAAMMASGQKELAPVVDIIDSIKVETDGKKILVKTEVTEDTIKEGLKKASNPKEND
jgi:hypothetical protein